jgi:dTDP-4-dehydrorhamnose reductase
VLGRSDAPLKPLSVDEVNFAAPRPRFAALSNRKLAAAGFEMPTWQDALARHLQSGRAS